MRYFPASRSARLSLTILAPLVFTTAGSGQGSAPFSQSDYCCVLETIESPETLTCNSSTCSAPGVGDCESAFSVETSTIVNASCKFAPELVCTRRWLDVAAPRWKCVPRQAGCPSGYYKCTWTESGSMPVQAILFCHGGDLCGL